MPTLLRELLLRKGSRVVTTTAGMPLRDAVVTMVEAKVGSALVMDPAGGIAGILTERDVLHALARWPEGIAALRVEDVMTPRVVAARPDDTVEEVMALMTARRFRHVPVVENGRLLGVISIGDLVKEQVAQAHQEIRELEGYITGRYPG